MEKEEKRKVWKEWARMIHSLVRGRMNLTLLDDVRFVALALGGEAGELQNVVKKQWRGDMQLTDMLVKVKEELADVRIYTEILADVLDHLSTSLINPKSFDLDVACYEKLKAKEQQLLKGGQQ